VEWNRDPSRDSGPFNEAGLARPPGLAAILYEVEPIDGPADFVLQSELVQ